MYGQSHFNSSIFSKGPLLAITPSNFVITISSSTISLKTHKKSLRSSLLELQNEGESENLPNFLDSRTISRQWTISRQANYRQIFLVVKSSANGLFLDNGIFLDIFKNNNLHI